MFLGRVVGTVIATRKIGGLQGIRLLVVQPVTEKGVDRSGLIVAADTTQAGPGDVVHVTSSREAALAMPDTFVPVDHAIIAIVDRVGGEPLPVARTWPAVRTAKRAATSTSTAASSAVKAQAKPKATPKSRAKAASKSKTEAQAKPKATPKSKAKAASKGKSKAKGKTKGKKS